MSIISKLKQLSAIDNIEGKTSYQINAWWNSRRRNFNICLVVFGAFSLIVLSFIVRGLLSFFFL